VLAGLAAGADDCIPRSIEPALLKARVRAQIRRKQFEDENRRVRLDLLSRVQQADLVRGAVDLSRLAAAAAADLQQREPSRAVEVRIAPGMTAHADARLMRIVFDNLLGNAWKFTGGAPHPRIEVGLQPGARPTTYFVRDNGAGFDMRRADRLFRPFQRLHTSAEFTGTGIGLATVARVVDRHGGRVWAESSPGAGATFLFTLEPS
jgi:light-regulated signal transduction histidine kinase (bacteriophytochrome)